MSAPRTTGFSLKRAILISLALHLALAAALVVAPQSTARFAGAGDGDATKAVTVSRITIAFRPHAARAANRASTPVRVARTERSHPAAAAVAATKPARYVRAATKPARAVASRAFAPGTSAKIVANALVAPNARSGAADAAPAATAAPAVAAAPERTLAVSVAVPVPSPSAPPAQTVAVAESAARVDVPSGGWGQSAKPLVADDDELAKLRASEHVSGTITIAVDDSGRATHVTLPASLAIDVRDELEKKLLGMHYLPAECNGLRCVGTLQLTL